MPPVDVAAGLVFRKGRLLIARRPAGGHLAGLWEFPGGKREPGESFTQCLKRELLEELGVHVRAGELVEAIEHRYPGKTVRLQFFACETTDPEEEPSAREGQEIAWVGREELDAYEFPEADARLLEKLKSTPEFWE